MKDKSDLERLKANANTAKERLMEIEDALREAGFIREANSLSAIIGKLEVWQNK